MQAAGNSQSSRLRLNIVRCEEGPRRIPFLNNKYVDACKLNAIYTEKRLMPLYKVNLGEKNVMDE